MAAEALVLRLTENETLAAAELSQSQASQLRQQFGDTLDVQRFNEFTADGSKP